MQEIGTYGVSLLYFDVAYLAEPMVNYRLHKRNMTNLFLGMKSKEAMRDEVYTVSRIHDAAKALLYDSIAQKCKKALIDLYVEAILRHEIGDANRGITVKEFRESIKHFVKKNGHKRQVFKEVMEAVGDHCYRVNEHGKAKFFYINALVNAFMNTKIWLKLSLLFMGVSGAKIRETISKFIKKTTETNIDIVDP